VFGRSIGFLQPQTNLSVRLDREIQESQATHDPGLICPDDLAVARNPSPAVDLEAKTRLAALDRRNGLKSAAVFGKIQHDAAVLFAELQVHKLLCTSAYNRAFILSCRFHDSSALTTAQAKARGGQNRLAYWRSRHGH
jgi:hypothetical protein